MKTRLLLISIVLIMISGCKNPGVTKTEFPDLTGPYLGQPAPDSVPTLFAPGIVGTGMFTRDMAISPAGDEILYCVSIGNHTYGTILWTRLEGGAWTAPEVVPFASSGKTFDFEPAFSPDGNRIYFMSSRADGNEKPGDQDIWYVERTPEGWGSPVNPGSPLNSDGGEFFPSPTEDGYLYFTHNDKGSGLNEIFRSRIYTDSFGTPELLPHGVNCGTNRFNAFVSPDHTYSIVPAMGIEGAYDQVDYYITFRDENDTWSTPVNMGPAINKGNTRGWSPYVSPDGGYFFFMANWSDEIPADSLSYSRLQHLYNASRNGNADIYWMNTGVIDRIRKQVNGSTRRRP